MMNFGDEMTAVAPSPVELSFRLDAPATEQLRRVSSETGLTADALIGAALRLLFIAADARTKRRRLLITSPSGYPIKELLIPATPR